MKKFTILIVFMFLLLSRDIHARDWSTIRIGVEGTYPPFSSITPAGELVGFDIDISHALCDFLHAQCTLIQQDWDGIIPALLVHKYDAIIASVTITEERKKKVAFTKKYYQTPVKFVAPKNLIFKILSGQQWRKKVGVQRATIHDNYLTQNFGNNVEILRYGTLEEAFLDLKAGRMDLLLADGIALSEGFLKQPGNEAFQFIGPDLTDPKWFGEGIGIVVRLEDQDLVALFNQAIDGIRANGTYHKIQAKYFDFDIYGE